MRARTQRTFYAIVVLAGLGFAALVWQRASAGRQTAGSARPLPLVQVAKPGQVNLQRKLLLTADILPIQQADLMAKVAGYLDAIYVDRGDRVRAGQVLAMISQPELEHQLQQAQANYDFAKVTYERTRELFAKDLIAKQNLDDAANKYEVAKRMLDVQRTYLQYARIVAPFDGYVTKRYVDPGALIAQGSSSASGGNTVVTVMDLSQVKVLVNVPERDIGSVHLTDPVSLTVDAYPDRTFRGKVTKFAPALDPSSRTLLVEIDVPNEELTLKPGMFARVTLVLETRPQALTVPSEALLVNELGSFLYVLGPPEDGAPTVHRVAVRTGIEDGGRVEILAGLGPNDDFVRAGKELVREGSRIRIAEDATQPTRVLSELRDAK
jgi:membrane fusion protein, multidrug efflux system